jgi:hypothetical protein
MFLLSSQIIGSVGEGTALKILKANYVLSIRCSINLKANAEEK